MSQRLHDEQLISAIINDFDADLAMFAGFK